MAIVVQQGSEMNNPYRPSQGQPSGNTMRADASAAVTALTYGGLWREPPRNPLTNTTNVRLDLQGYTGNHQMNLQLQVNGVRAPSTVAAVLVDDTVQALAPPSIRSGPQQTEIVRAIKTALLNSLNSYVQGNPRIWTVTGVPSS